MNTEGVLGGVGWGELNLIINKATALSSMTNAFYSGGLALLKLILHQKQQLVCPRKVSLADLD